MEMTHYMELLATNQPWNLLIFMAGPVILAETIAVSELYLLFTRNFNTWVKTLSQVSGIILGIYFLGIFLYLMKTAFIPLTVNMEWRGIFDVIAVSFYLLGVIPLVGIGLLDAGIFCKKEEQKLKWHAIFVGMFLIVAHIAMIFGMLSPALLSGEGMGM